jgi:periplasmic divalent cation tolerance protein
MTSKVMAISSCSSRAEADAIARALVEQRLAACVQIVPGAVSVYRWKDAIEQAEETLLFIKTAEALVTGLREALARLHSYEVPELIVLPIVDGAPAYLAWMEKELTQS